jgi:hypothetical protein
MANTLEYNTSRSDANFTLWDTWCGKPGAISNRRSTLNDRSAVALVTGIVNMIHKMVSIEGYSTGFTAQSEVDIWSRGVILQRVRHRAISLLNSSKLHVYRITYYIVIYIRRVAPYTPTRSCVHIGVQKKKKSLIARCYTPACSPSSDLPLEFV